MLVCQSEKTHTYVFNFLVMMLYLIYLCLFARIKMIIRSKRSCLFGITKVASHNIFCDNSNLNLSFFFLMLYNFQVVFITLLKKYIQVRVNNHNPKN